MLPSSHPVLPSSKIGVLLVNLGTPEATDYWSIRRYLSEFLSDRRVVELPALLWQPLLQGIILTVRPKKTGHAYARIWDTEKNQSPLKTITQSQATALQKVMGDQVIIDWAMRYGQPTLRDRLQALKDCGCDRILVAPLYPQYSGATTASVVDEAGRALRHMRWQPSLRYLPPYYDDANYIAALAQSIKVRQKSLDWEPDGILVSFHGMPRRTLELGDPYHCHCQKTARLLREALDWPAERYFVTFQSRFGRAEWLKPYTDQTMAALPGQGIKKLIVVSPAFASDCIETLEELALVNRDLFMEKGGQNFNYVPCLNDSPEGIAFLKHLVTSNLQGWLS